MDDVRAYQLHLIGQKYPGHTSIRSRAPCAFFYGITLDQKGSKMHRFRSCPKRCSRTCRGRPLGLTDPNV
jgi:hypothetical protein